jgi:hypothetical protein
MVYRSQKLTKLIRSDFCFVHPIFRFWSLLVTKLRKYYVIIVYILQGKMGKMRKNRKENHATKVTKIPKNQRRKYGMNKTIISNYLFKVVKSWSLRIASLLCDRLRIFKLGKSKMGPSIASAISLLSLKSNSTKEGISAKACKDLES